MIQALYVRPVPPESRRRHQLLNVPLMNIKIIERYTVTSMSEGSRILTEDFDKILTLALAENKLKFVGEKSKTMG